MSPTGPVPDRKGASVSVVVPVHDDAATLRELHHRLVGALATVGDDWEVVFVDDGSRDPSWPVIEELVAAHDRTVGLRLTRNFGQTPAVLAGAEAARGAGVVVIDADLEVLPEDVPLLVAAWREGHDLVTGVRHGPRAAGRSLGSRLFNRWLSRVTGERFSDVGCGLVLFDRDLVGRLLGAGDLRRNFMVIAAAAQLADRRTEVPVRTEVRGGPSSYDHFSLVMYGVEALFAFGRPFRSVATAAAASALLGAAGTVGCAAALLAGAGAAFWSLLAVAVSVTTAGVVLGAVAVLGNQVVRTLRYHGTPFVQVREVRGRPGPDAPPSGGAAPRT